MTLEVHVLDPDGQRFEEAETDAVQELREEAEGRLQPVQEREHLALREDGREVVRPSSRLEAWRLKRAPERTIIAG